MTPEELTDVVLEKQAAASTAVGALLGGLGGAGLAYSRSGDDESPEARKKRLIDYALKGALGGGAAGLGYHALNRAVPDAPSTADAAGAPPAGRARTALDGLLTLGGILPGANGEPDVRRDGFVFPTDVEYWRRQVAAPFTSGLAALPGAIEGWQRGRAADALAEQGKALHGLLDGSAAKIMTGANGLPALAGGRGLDDAFASVKQHLLNRLPADVQSRLAGRLTRRGFAPSSKDIGLVRDELERAYQQVMNSVYTNPGGTGTRVSSREILRGLSRELRSGRQSGGAARDARNTLRELRKRVAVDPRKVDEARRNANALIGKLFERDAARARNERLTAGKNEIERLFGRGMSAQDAATRTVDNITTATRAGASAKGVAGAKGVADTAKAKGFFRALRSRPAGYAAAGGFTTNMLANMIMQLAASRLPDPGRSQ